VVISREESMPRDPIGPRLPQNYLQNPPNDFGMDKAPRAFWSILVELHPGEFTSVGAFCSKSDISLENGQ